MKKQQVSCPVCDSAEFTVMYVPWTDVTDPVKLYGAASGVQGTQQVVSCNKCEMMYENPRYPQDVILSGYTNADDDGHDSQYPNRVLSFYNTLASLRNQNIISKNKITVLDIGTSSGAFIEASNKIGYATKGLEPSKFLVEQGVKRGLDITQGTIEHNSIAEKFDLVTLWDVIEHVSNPLQELQNLKNLIKAEGVLLLNIPDHGSWMAKIAGKKFWWILSVHLHFFSKKSITDICNRAGYDVVHTQLYWQTLSLGYLFDIAEKLKVPLVGIVKRALPKAVKNIPVKYYASQLTVIAKIKNI